MTLPVGFGPKRFRWVLNQVLILVFFVVLGSESNVRGAAEPTVADARMITATGAQFVIYINGVRHRPGPDSGTESNPINVDIREDPFTRVSMLAIKETEKIGPGQPMMLSYIITIELSNGKEKTFHSNQIKDHAVWFDPDGLSPPPKDSKGRQWFELDYDDSKWTKGENINSYRPPFGGVEPARESRTRYNFLSSAPNRARSATKNSVQYFRRRIVLWGKPPKPTATPKPTLSPAPPTPVPTPTPKPTPTISPTNTITLTVTKTITSTFTYTKTPTLEPDEPTPLPTETPLPTLTPTEIIEDTAVPTEAPTIPPTAEATPTPTERPIPTQPPATRMPTKVPAMLLNGFEKAGDLWGVTGQYMTLSLSQSTEGVTQGENCARVRIKLGTAFKSNGDGSQTARIGPRGVKIPPRGEKPSPTPRPYLPTLRFGFDTPSRLRTTNFSTFKKIMMDVGNPNRAGLNIIFSLSDSKGYEHTFRPSSAQPQAKTTIEFDLSEARAARLDLTMIQSLNIGIDVRGQARDPILYFDFLRLE